MLPSRGTPGGCGITVDMIQRSISRRVSMQGFWKREVEDLERLLIKTRLVERIEVGVGLARPALLSSVLWSEEGTKVPEDRHFQSCCT